MTKSKKIRVYPTTEQRETLRQWLGTARFTYNKTVALLNETDTKANWKAIKTGILHDLPDWSKETPYQIKSIAVRDACIAVREAKRKCKKTGEFQSVSFKSKRHPSDSIFIPKSAIKPRGVYRTLLGDLKMSEMLPDNICDSRLVKENDKYYLCVSYTVTIPKRKPNGRVVALDPGVRTFLTYFHECGFGWLGHHAINRIQRLCSHLDNLLSHARTLLGDLKMSEMLPDNICDSRLVKENDKYYLCVSYTVTAPKRKSNGRVVALDPGVRTFLTYFHERGFGWLGHHAINRIQRLCSHLDNLLSHATKATQQSRKNMRRAANRIRTRIRNLVDELHHKVARYLVDNFDIILLPTFETSDMVMRGKRKLRKKSARQMLTLSHYRFKQFLKHKAEETGCIVVDVCEAYTSKTVSWNGEIRKSLGGRKIIKDSTGLKMNRDLNGARGIFLRALVDEPWLLSMSNLQTV